MRISIIFTFFKDLQKDYCNHECSSKGECGKNSEGRQAVVQVQDSQWYQPTSLDQVLNLMKKLKGKNYGLVFGSTGNGMYR